MKSEWEIGHIESSYSGRQYFEESRQKYRVVQRKVIFLPLLREASTNARNVRFSIHFSTHKRAFYACVKKTIFMISNPTDRKNFMNNIRIYNNLFAFASFEAKLVTFSTAGPQVFRVCGQTCHNSYSLNSES